MHQKVQIVILRLLKNETQVLLLKTNSPDHSFWQHVTGSVETNDSSILDAAKREVMEETGLQDLHYNDLNFSLSFTDRFNRKVKEHIFLGTTTGEYPIILSREHCEYRWTPIEKILASDYYYESSFQAFLAAKKRAQYNG